MILFIQTYIIERNFNKPLSELDADQDIVLNQDLLKQYNVNLDENASVKAGDVLIAASPFVSVLATSCRGKRCEYCFLEKDVKVYCERYD